MVYVANGYLPDIVIPKDWAWDICEDHISNKAREILLQYKKDKAEGKLETVPLRSLIK